MQIIDAETAFVGGMNLGCEYAGKDPSIGGWRDIQLQLRGNVTAELQDVFANDTITAPSTANTKVRR